MQNKMIFVLNLTRFNKKEKLADLIGFVELFTLLNFRNNSAIILKCV